MAIFTLRQSEGFRWFLFNVFSSSLMWATDNLQSWWLTRFICGGQWHMRIAKDVQGASLRILAACVYPQWKLYVPQCVHFDVLPKAKIWVALEYKWWSLADRRWEQLADPSALCGPPTWSIGSVPKYTVFNLKDSVVSLKRPFLGCAQQLVRALPAKSFTLFEFAKRRMVEPQAYHPILSAVWGFLKWGIPP